MSSPNKRLKPSELSHEGIEFSSLSEASQQEIRGWSDHISNLETNEDARNVLELLQASTPDLVRVVDEEDGTLLHQACRSPLCQLELIRYLVDCFPEALQVKALSCLPLHEACSNRSISIEVIQYLVEKYPRALEEKGSNDELPLHLVVHKESCSVDLVSYLVQQNPNALKQKNDVGDLPLAVACEHSSCSLQVLCFLMEQYPTAVNHKNRSGMVPLHYCILRFKDNTYNYSSLLDRMRLFLPRYPEAMDVVLNFHPNDFGDELFWPEAEELALYKQVAALLLEEIPLRDQWEWAKQVVEDLSWICRTIGVEITACLWAKEWRDVCRHRLDVIEERLEALENPLNDARTWFFD